MAPRLVSQGQAAIVKLVRFQSTLEIRSQRVKDAVLKGEWTDGPPSLRTKRARLAYNSPVGLKEVFPLAYDIIQKEKSRHYGIAEQIKSELSSSETDPAKARELNQELNKHLVRAELNDPEVQYNYRMKNFDLTQPVYRHLAARDWKQYDMLIMLQRIEQLHVIPDTMPTIEPRAAVSLQFPGVINKWVTPGEVLRNSVCTRTPSIKIQEFEKIADNSLYTILIVDPDTPDVENDSFKTTLHWAVSNIPLSNTDPAVDLSKSQELVPFLPPHPEKNTPTHRYCVWAFRQSADPSEVKAIEVDGADLVREDFNIRSFAAKYGLDAVGAHVWRCNYDLSTDEVRAKFGLGPGMVFSKVRQ